ncbi:MAG: TusE/DsrC/DsvC family sulfur relay protein [Wenzhouxiangella sp.]|nr:TusE/DsrC/DsvC family sulfur relay protein [Wenzhouxiangella sp.]MCH8479419.1 TusE/DsrC/DsvC family sulfur relay protein [Wenzhouxiangella sp.]TVR94800.1 MAG: TusE/DsrC/DsvC family sulfur relay protein [Wenzhouxiangellaceae bacterium]
MNPTLEIDGMVLELDEHGHLQDADSWQPAIGMELARRDGLELDDRQWWLIHFVRDYHGHYGNPPLMRVLVRAMREQFADQALGSRDLYRLFPDNPVRQACKYGGLPVPDWCI